MSTPPLPEEYLADPSRYFLEWIPLKLDEQRDLADRFQGKRREVAQIHLTGERGGKWYFIVGDGGVRVDGGEHERPSFTIVMAVDTWRGLRRGTINGLRAFLRGDIKIRGSKLALLRVARMFK